MAHKDPPEIKTFIIDGPPWEKKHELGFFLAFVETIKAFLLRPAQTFSVMRRQSGIGDALVYTVALQVFTFLWTFATNDVDPAMFMPQSPELEGLIELPQNFSQIMILVYPVSVILLQFVSAMGVHLALKWRRLQSYDFTLIFRMFAYTAGTASVLLLIPVIGGMVSFAMLIYLGFIGLRTIYGLDLPSFLITAFMSLFITVGLYMMSIMGITVIILILSLLF